MLTRCGKDLPIEKISAHQARCSQCGGKPPRTPGSHLVVDNFTDLEAVDIIAACDKFHWKVLFWILWETGCRIGEGMLLMRRDIDLGRGMVQITREKRRDKLKEWRPISSDLRDEVARYLDSLPRTRQALFPYWHTSANAALDRAALRAGITRPVHSHMFRRSFARRLSHKMQGTALDARSRIQQALGHINPATTDIYLQATPDEANEEIRRILES